MPNRSWIERVCELETQGRDDEARQLYEQNTTPEQRAELEMVLRQLAQVMPRVTWPAVPELDPEFVAEVGQLVKRLRAAKHLPDGHPKKEPWIPLLDMMPYQVLPFWRLLLDKADPLKSKGRPRQSKIPAGHFDEMTRRVAAGEIPRAAAKAIVGKLAGAENKADHLVKMWKRKTGLK